MLNHKLRKSLSIVILVCVGLITLAAISLLPQVKFDYKFEKFLPPSDEDLQFYWEHIERFESDNDFLLVGLGNDDGVFQEDFLIKVDSLTTVFEGKDYIEKVASPTNIDNPIIGPLGVIKSSYIHVSQPELYEKDSARVYDTPGLKGSLFSEDGKKVSLFLKIKHSDDRKLNDKTISEIESIIESYQFDDSHVAGKIKGAFYFIKKMESDLLLFMSLSCILLIVFLYISFRSLWGILIPMAVVGITILWMIAFMTLIGKPINFMTTLLPTILFVVCISNVVHIVEKYLDELRKKKSKLEALTTAFTEIGLATFFTAFTTAVGFLSLYTAMILPIKEFGWITAIGVYVAFLLSFSLLPALLYLLKTPKVKGKHSDDSFWSKKLHTLFLWVIPQRQKIFSVVLVVMCVSFVGIHELEFDNKFLDDYASGEDMRNDYSFFEENFSGFRPFEMAVTLKDTNLSFFDLEVMQEVAKIETGIKEVYGAGFIVSPNTFIKGTRRAINGGKNKEYKLPASKSELKKIKLSLRRLPKANLRSYVTDNGFEGRINAKVKDVGGKQMRLLNQKFDAYLIENVNQDLFEFRVTGMPFLVDKTNESLANNIIYSLTIAFIIIALIMGILFQSFRMIIIAVLPNLLPLLVIAGFMGLAGITIKISTSIIFAIAFGIAVDDTIHFMSKLRIELNKGKSIVYALKRTYLSTGKAIIVTSLILCSGFLILVGSAISSTFYIGLLVSLTLLFAVLSDLFFLPVLILMFFQEPKKKRRLFSKKTKTV